MHVVTYYELYINTKNIEYLVDKREEMIKLSFELGVSKTSRFYKTSRNTIKRWRSRYLRYGRKGLYDMSKRPHNIPKMTSSEVVRDIKTLAKEKKKAKHLITSTQVYKKLDLKGKISYETCNKYVNEALGKKRGRKKEKTNGGSTEWKKDLKPFERIQVDVKYLSDISSLKVYLKDGSLAKYEFTFRDVSSGLAFVAYASEKSVTNNYLFFEKVIYIFLSSISSLNLKEVKIQTDNGSENTNRKRRGPYTGMNKKSIVTEFIEEHFKEHILIIPGHCTAQSDVESFHWTIERECLAWEDITDNESLLYYTDKFLQEYNNRKRWKCDYTPVEKVESYFNCKIEIPKAIILD